MGLAPLLYSNPMTWSKAASYNKGVYRYHSNNSHMRVTLNRMPNPLMILALPIGSMYEEEEISLFPRYVDKQ